MRFHVDIVGSESLIYSGQSDQTIVPTKQGELGIYARHAPLIAFLKPGLLRIFLDNKEKKSIFVLSGFVEVQPHMVTILADKVLRSEEFDTAAAQAATYIDKHNNKLTKSSIDAELALQIDIYRSLKELTRIKNKLV